MTESGLQTRSNADFFNTIGQKLPKAPAKVSVRFAT
jgi:hypothetical protein